MSWCDAKKTKTSSLKGNRDDDDSEEEPMIASLGLHQSQQKQQTYSFCCC